MRRSLCVVIALTCMRSAREGLSFLSLTPEFNDFNRIAIRLVNAPKGADDISDFLLGIAGTVR